MADTHELRLKIDAGAAKSGAREFTGAIASIKKAVRDLDRDSSGAFAKLSQVDASGLKTVTREATNTAKATSAVERETKRLADQMKRTALSSASALRTSEQAAQRLALRLGDLGDTSGITRLESALARMQSNLINATNTTDVRVAKSQFDDLRSSLLQNTVAAEHLRGEQAQLARQTEEAARAAATKAESLDRLRAKYNPVAKASMEYARTLDEIALAEKEGVLSAQIAGDARQRAAAQLAGASAAVDQHTAAMRRNASTTQQGIMAGHQLTDVLVTAQMGFQSVGMIALQQGSQLAAQMNSLKAAGGGVFRTLLAGLTSLVNPLSLITIGAVAAGATIAKWFFAAGEETKSFGDALSDASSKIQTLRSASDALATGNLSNLRREYGAVNEELRIHLERLQQVAKIDARNVNRDLIASIEDALTSDGNPFTGSIDEVRRVFDTTNDSARHMLALMQDIQTAATFEDQAASVSRLRSEVERVTGGLGRAEGKALDALTQLIKSEDAAKKLMAAQEGTTKATGRAASAASGLSSQLGTAADAARQLLATMGAVPGAVAALGRSIDDQIAGIQSENKSLTLQLDLGLSSQAANRRVQLDDLLKSGALSPDQAAGEFAKINELEGLAKQQAALRKQISETNRTSQKGGGGRKAEIGEYKKLIEAAQKRVSALGNESTALQSLADGTFRTMEAANLMARAQQLTGGAVDATTAAIINQIDAAAKLNEELQRVANDPVRAWRDSVPGWYEAGQQIEVGVIGNLKDALSEMMQTGTVDVESFGQAILGTVSEIVADKAMKELHTLIGGESSFLAPLLGDALGQEASLGDGATSTGPAVMQNAMMTGGQQAGQAISQAMVQAGQQVSSQMQGGMSQGGTQAGAQVRSGHQTGGSIAANQTRTAAMTGGRQHAAQVQAAITQAGSQHAQMVGAASGGGGGFFSQVLGAVGGAVGIPIPAFAEGGYSDAPTAVNFQHAPHFSSGTPNTSGIPSILHPNEAVIPLSKGRKIPVEMPNGSDGGKAPITQNFNWNIQAPDADSFRRSQRQIAADAGTAMQRNIQKIR